MPRTLLEENSIDRSISFLLIGLAIVGFMVLTIAGMSTIQKSAENTRSSSSSSQETTSQATFDFGE